MTNRHPENEVDRGRHRLLERIGRDNPIAVEELQVGSLQLSFTRVADPDAVLHDLEAGENGEPAWQPYWAAAWKSALAVAAVLVKRHLEGSRVMDLGCGLGLTGTVAAACGANVVMADAAQPALLFARLNSWPWRERVRIRALNWRTDRLEQERFDLIVGSDVVYEAEEWPHLESCWRYHLAPCGSVLLGEPGRRASDGFSDWLATRGWNVQSSTMPVDEGEIRIYEAAVKSAPSSPPEE